MRYHILFKLSEIVVDKFSREDRNEFVKEVINRLTDICGPYEDTKCSFKISFNHNYYHRYVLGVDDIRSFEIELDKDDYSNEMIDFVRGLFVNIREIKHKIFSVDIKEKKYQIFSVIVHKCYGFDDGFERQYYSSDYTNKIYTFG